MSKIDPDFLRAVQAAGWILAAVDETRAVGACPRHGCGLKVALRPGQDVPATSGRSLALPHCVLEGYEDARVYLRDRRESLALSIKDVEECSGMTVDYLAKCEKDDPSKMPNVRTFLEWAQSLGVDVVLMPSKMPAVTARRIADTRSRSKSRARRWQIENDRRARERDQ